MAEGLSPQSAAEDRAAVRFLAWWRERATAGAWPPTEDYLAEHPMDARHTERLAQERECLLAPRGPIDPRSTLRMRIGRFEVLRELGSGGQGVVYLARDPGLARLVALKVLHPHRMGGEAKERFKREADALARIEDPAIATVYEVDLDGPTPYMAMRFVPGRSLLDLLTEARREPTVDQRASTLRLGSSRIEDIQDIVRVGLRCARALERAHAAGVIHRDIKPGNVQVSTEGETVLLDFGLARHDASSRDLTHTGERPGTPRYMSPEQLFGDGAVDGRTDVWSLGVTLYEALTLEHPFQIDSRAGRGTTILARAIQNRRPRSARHSNPGVPSDLDWVLERALEEDLGRRYPSAAALAADLERFLLGEPVEARPPSLFYRSRRLLARHRPSAAAIGLITLLVLVQQLVLRSRLSHASERIEGVHAAELRQRKAVLDAVQWLSSEIDFERVDESLQERGPSGVIRAERMLEQLRAMVAEQGAMDATPESRIEQRLLRSALANAEGEFELALSLLLPAGTDARDVEELPEAERVTLLLRAHALRETGDNEGALAASERLLEIVPDPASILINCGNILSDLKRFDEALAAYEAGLALCPNSPWGHAQRGQLRFWLKDSAGALEDFEQAARLAPSNAAYRFNYAVTLGNSGRIEEAIAELDDVALLSPERGIVYLVRGRDRYNLRQYELALEDIEKAFELTPEPPLDWYLDRARVEHLLARPAAALEDLNAYLAGRPDHVVALNLRGHVRAALADLEGALADFDRAFELGSTSSTLAYNRAALLHDLGRHEQALALLVDSASEDQAALRALCLQALGGEGAPGPCETSSAR